MTGLRDEIFGRYAAENRLHAAMIELTHRCPCDCQHCFLVRDGRDELTTAEVLDLLDQLREEGAFNLGLTGGEPFLRRDLPEILARAHTHRFFVSILTTALTIGPAEVAMLQEHRVQRLEVSLLGATAATHDAIMRRPGAFARTLQAVSLLVAGGLDVRLKTTVLRPNRHELPAIRELARGLGAHYEANIVVSPRIDGDREPLDLALTQAELVDIDPSFLNAGPIPGEDPSAGAVLVCKAGRTVAAIGPRGEVYPCLLFRRPVGNLRERSLRGILHDAPDPFLTELRALEPADITGCRTCALQARCQRCPGITYLETGDVRRASPSACALAEGLHQLQKND